MFISVNTSMCEKSTKQTERQKYVRQDNKVYINVKHMLK